MIEAMESAKLMTQQGVGRFLTTFSHVPDDKLNWSPSQTAKSPLRIAVHTGAALGIFPNVLRGEPLPPGAGERIGAMMAEAERSVTTRDAAVALLEKNLEAVLSALDEMTSDRLETIVETPFGKRCMRELVFGAAMHTHTHAAQIDYLETIWGDMEFYM